MKLYITHHTRYTFSEPVSLYPHVFRFKPRPSQLQDIRSFSLKITPRPDGYVENRDAAGNDVQFAWFNDPAAQFHILAEMEVETSDDNPLDFIIYPFESARFPVLYRSDDDVALVPFLTPISEDADVRSFADEIAQESGGAVIPFVLLLIRRIYEGFETVVRETGEPLRPQETLRRRSGSCRDYTVLAIAVLRYKGIAARFVSGYEYLDDEASHDLHAWVEVYFPGGGWRGFDATTGLTVNERYVRVAAGAAPVNTLPVTGAYGGGARSSLETNIRIRKG